MIRVSVFDSALTWVFCTLCCAMSAAESYLIYTEINYIIQGSLWLRGAPPNPHCQWVFLSPSVWRMPPQFWIPWRLLWNVLIHHLLVPKRISGSSAPPCSSPTLKEVIAADFSAGTGRTLRSGHLCHGLGEISGWRQLLHVGTVNKSFTVIFPFSRWQFLALFLLSGDTALNCILLAK